MIAKQAPKWLAPDGSPVACVEKLKVLEENLAEFRTLALELLEDAVLMGCDPELVRDVLKAEVEGVDTHFKPAQARKG
ncbi:hypothetical protein [Magnetospirillum sp. 15-1]|uniref:hypothetical protein n=1 Tax=Magnetospirillum sp. 15-1 TaxID=1979370 RepID=UPI000BBC7CCF|nr:hypothetical protein [Magnetospirillum sp. 15-1]